MLFFSGLVATCIMVGALFLYVSFHAVEKENIKRNKVKEND